jgi:hypothetical protein
MKTVMEKTASTSGKNSRQYRSTKARLKRLLKSMLASGPAFELIAQPVPPSYRRVVE